MTFDISAILSDMQDEVNERSPASLLASAHLFTLLMTEHNEVKNTGVAPGDWQFLSDSPTRLSALLAQHDCIEMS